MKAMNDPGLLARVFDKLGWKVVMDAHVRTYSIADAAVVYKWVAMNPSQHGYDLGIIQDPQTKLLSIAGDTSMMRQDVWDVLGKDFCKVKQQYALLSVTEQVDANCGTHSHTMLSTGVIKLNFEMDVEVFA